MDESSQPSDVEQLRATFPGLGDRGPVDGRGDRHGQPVSAGVQGRCDPLGVDSGGPRRRDQTGDRHPLM